MKLSEAHITWNALVQELQNKKSEIDNLLGAAKQISEQLTVLQAESKSRSDEIIAIQAQLNEKTGSADQLVQQISAQKLEAENQGKTIGELAENAAKEKDSISETLQKTEQLLKTNSEQSQKISDLLQKAAAGNLFKSFNLRKDEHEKSSRFWRWMVAISIVVLAAGAIYLVTVLPKEEPISYGFLAKFSVSGPLIYWLIFSTRQYTKSKRFEEEYAFKSAISLSLEAYRDLIKRESGEATKEDVIPFITSAVSGIFSSPTETVAKNPHREDGDITDSVINRLQKIFEMFKK